MHNKTILITGVNGFIGGHLTNFLIEHYPTCNIVGIYRNEKCHSSCKTVHVDLLNVDAVAHIINEVKPDYIFHLAGTTYSYEWEKLYAGNVTATINLLEAIKKLELPSKIVTAGSAAEYGLVLTENLPVRETYLSTPLTPYGLTKYWQTQIAQYYSVKGVNVMGSRIFNIIGKGLAEHLTIGSYLKQLNNIAEGKKSAQIKVGDLRIKRDYLDIEDVCSALVAVISKGKKGHFYNISSGVAVNNKTILDLLLQHTSRTIEIIFDSNETKNAAVMEIAGCNNKIKEHTHWQPSIKLNESVKKALDI